MREPEPGTAIKAYDGVYKIPETTAAVVTAVLLIVLKGVVG